MAEKIKIQTLNNISPLGLSRLPSERYTIGNEVANPDALLVRSAKMHDMEIPASVKAIARAGAGTNNVPVAKMSQRGIPVFNAPGANANAVKELVIAGMLIAARKLMPAWDFADGLTGEDAEISKAVEAGKKNFAGMELPNRTLGIIGLGSIGSMVADAGIRLGMNVIGFDPEITVEAAWRLPSNVKKAANVEEVVKNSDFVSLHVPLSDKTRHMIDAARIALMRPNTVLLNFAREGIVDDKAVVEGIASGKLRGYVCDFPSNTLKNNPQVVVLPHLGASTEEAEENCAIMVAEQVRDFLENGNISNAVNFPNVAMPRESAYRIAIANANVPNMVGQISTAMADAGLNIHNMLNKSKGEMAYTLVDVDSEPPQGVIDKIAAIQGVLMVRSIPAH